MIKILELSLILVAAGIFASQEDQILREVKNIYASPKVIEESEIHETHLQDDLKTSIDSPCRVVKEI